MIVEINGCSIHYKVFGTGQPIVFIHGFPEDHEVLANCFEPIFAEVEGYQRIYIDLPGMGKSRASEVLRTADDMLSVIQSFIKQVIKAENYLLVGQSYGGYLSLGLANVIPEKIDGIFLLCPCVKAERSKRTLPKRQVREEIDFSIDESETEAYSDFMEMAVIANEMTWSSYKKDILPGLLRANDVFVNDYQSNGYALSFEADFNQNNYDRPVTFLTGKQDDCVGYRDAFELADSFSHATFLTIDNAGHNLQIEQPELFQDVFKRWLAEVKN